MSFLFYVNMQKRKDGKVYCDLHKTDEKIYFTREDAQRAVDMEHPEFRDYRHVVAICAEVCEDIE